MKLHRGAKTPDLAICQTPSGFYKVYWWGVQEDHISDWRGCAYRFVTVQGQPKLGYLTVDDARKFLAQVQGWDEVSQDVEITRALQVGGASIPDRQFVDSHMLRRS